MKMWIKSGGLLLVLLISMQWAFAAPFVREASFQRIFDGEDKIFDGEDYSNLEIKLSTMSSDGKVVAFWGNGPGDGYEPHLFIHDFDSTDAPIEVPLPPRVGYFNTNAGLTSNADGSRIFFVADDASNDDGYTFLFCMLNGKTGVVTILLTSRPPDVEEPQDIATDAAGDYLYFNESDNGDQGDLWRIQAVGGALPVRVIEAGSVAHPSGGPGRFVDEFDVSDDGQTIAFFINGRNDPVDGWIRTDKELFVKSVSGIANLTDTPSDKDNGMRHLRLSGDGSTVVYAGSETASFSLMTTTSTSPVNAQQRLLEEYTASCNKPGITTDGSVIFSRMTSGTASGFLIRSDGSDQLKMDT